MTRHQTATPHRARRVYSHQPRRTPRSRPHTYTEVAP